MEDNEKNVGLCELIRQREEALRAAEKEQESCLKSSDRGWLLTMGSKEAGTYLAVTKAEEARRWGSLIEALRENIKELKEAERAGRQ